MKITKTLSLTALCALAALSSPSYANQAKFNKIERELKQCLKDVRGSYGEGSCMIQAVDDYSDAMSQKKRERLFVFGARCAVQYGAEDEREYEVFGFDNLSNADRSSAAYCKLEAARRIAKQR
ncbi:Uncharacterised protein [Moraxella cuniculi]|uniref:DUF1311 domain-containing protein n=2 Tax=Moraxella cuniculi TaxID=34061 RepID=A0A448GW21_9GAMM|nr:Uncharacterised protein [Moraxella cuniculi]